MSHQPVFLIGFAESVAAPEVTFSLRKATGARIICLCRRDGPSFARVKYVEYHAVTAPETDFDQAVLDTQQIVDQIRPDRAAACDDAAVLVMSRTAFQNEQRLIPGDSLCSYAMDKASQMVAAEICGFQVLKNAPVKSIDDIHQFDSFPAILKPRYALDVRGGHIEKGAMFFLDRKSGLRPAVYDAIDRLPYIIQQFMTGNGEGIFGIALDGKVHAVFGHRRIRMMNPSGSGASACESRRLSKDEIEMANRLIQHVRWQGPFMIELLRDHAGQSWFMEFNGRFWGSLALARRCGIDMPGIAFGLTDADTVPDDIPFEQGFARHLGRDLIHLLFVLSGKRGDVQHARWAAKFNAVRNVLTPNRLNSFYNYDPSQPLFFLKDTIFTLSNAIRGRKA